DVDHGRLQAAEAGPLDPSGERQLQVEPAGRRLQVKRGLDLGRLDGVGLAADLERLEMHARLDTPDIPRLEPQAGEVDHYPVASNPAVPPVPSSRDASCSRQRCTAARNLPRFTSRFSRMPSA